MSQVHPGKRIKGLKEPIDFALLPFLTAFWKAGGTSYMSCQGGWSEKEEWQYGRGFVIIDKKDFSLLKTLAPQFGMYSITKEVGDGGYVAGEYVDTASDDDSSRLYVEFKLKGVDYKREEE